MKRFSLLALIALLSSSCTISLSLVDTHGTASDVVDSTPKTETTTDAAVKIPAIGV